MGTIVELLSALETINLKEDTAGIVASNGKEYARMQAAQMMQGKNRKGKAIGAYRSLNYAKEKATLNPFLSSRIPDNVDLKLTGAFHRGLKMDVDVSFNIDVTSTDSKSDALEKKYGSEIFGLNDETQQTFVSGFIQPAFEKMVTSKTGLTFN